MIPFVDLRAQYLSIKNEIDEAIDRVLMNSSFIGGVEVSLFEENFAEWLGVNHFVSCANGTDSIEILLKGMGIGPGDEVIVPALSWISTSEAVTTVGATPVFVDIHEEYYTINEELIEVAITSNTKAIIPVHLYGQPCNMSRIMEIADKHNLKVLEDCAQAHGATWKGKKVGTYGHCSSFSFFPGKNLGAYGDAGGMATNDADLSSIIRMISNHGQKTKHDHRMEGRNSRLDGLQAAVLNVKLNFLDNWIERRVDRANYYSYHLSKYEDILTPAKHPEAAHAYHLYVIRSLKRANLMRAMEFSKVSCGIHYPVPLPFLQCYSYLDIDPNGYRISKTVCNEILSLPIYPELTEWQMDMIIRVIHETA